MSLLISFHLLASSIDFSDLDIPPADTFVQEQIIDRIDDDFAKFLAALAGVAGFRYLLRM